MYDLNTRGRLLVLSMGYFELIRVLSEDVIVAEAFALVGEAENLPEARELVTLAPGVVGQACTQSYILVPPGVDWVPGDVNDSVLIYVSDDESGVGVAGFSWGGETIDDEDRALHGFAKTVWEDGNGPRDWYPQD